jgi:hypothetical protein
MHEGRYASVTRSQALPAQSLVFADPNHQRSATVNQSETHALSLMDGTVVGKLDRHSQEVAKNYPYPF